MRHLAAEEEMGRRRRKRRGGVGDVKIARIGGGRGVANSLGSYSGGRRR